MMSTRINRRTFLKGAGSLASSICLPYAVPASVFGSSGKTAPSEKIVMGFVGVGSMGGGHFRTFLGFEDVHVAAVCDLRRIFREKAAGRVEAAYGGKGFVTYTDYREMLARSDIDAIVNATPDNWHALVGIEAARNRKDMYYEKPLSMSVAESKAVREAVNRYGVVFQFGTQQRSDRRFRLACELAVSGRIGRLETIMIGSYPSITAPNQPSEPAPPKEEFDYDTWLGPAQQAPYTYERCASRAMGTLGMWTFLRDYSLGGISGAWGIHPVDIAQWANGSDETGPVEISGTGRFPADGFTDTAIEWEIEHRYANGVRMVHMDTGTAMKRARQFELHSGLGVLLLGSEGWVFVCRDFIRSEPESLAATEFGPDEQHLYYSDNHRRNFLDCVRTRGQTVCPVEGAVRSDTICHLDDIAIRLGRSLRWDPEAEQFVGDDQANRLLSRPMRSPWQI